MIGHILGHNANQNKFKIIKQNNFFPRSKGIKLEINDFLENPNCLKLNMRTSKKSMGQRGSLR